MFFLVLSIVALAVGPLVAVAARARPWAIDLADGFVVVAVGGLVLLHVVPSSIEIGGPWALAAALGGLMAPLAFERIRKDHDHDLGHGHGPGRSSSTSGILALVVFLGVAVHSLLDGTALLELGDAPAARALAVSVIVHRVPVGLAIWWLVRPARGTGLALAMLALEGAGGVVGYFAGRPLVEGALGPHLSLFQAALAGALLHVLAHHAPTPSGRAEKHEHVRGHDDAHGIHAHDTSRRYAAGLGGLLAIGFVAWVTWSHPIPHRAIDELGARAAFFALARIVAMPLLAACAIAGVAHVVLPEKSGQWLSRGDGAVAAMRGLLVGMLLPVCSCGIVPLHRTLQDRRLAPSAAAGVLVASPELGPSALLLSFALLGVTLALARVCTAAAAAVVIAFLVSFVAKAHADPHPFSMKPAHRHAHADARESIVHAVRFGFVEMLDHTAPWLVAGLLAASLAEPTISHDAFVGLSPLWAVPIAAIAGVPFYVSASAAMPVVAVLLHKGLTPGAAVAFLLTGPAVTPATVALLGKRYGTGAARMFAVGAVAAAIGCGLAVDRLGAVAAPASIHESASLPEWIALAVLGALFVASILRQGPRAMLGKILAGG